MSRVLIEFSENKICFFLSKTIKTLNRRIFSKGVTWKLFTTRKTCQVKKFAVSKTSRLDVGDENEKMKAKWNSLEMSKKKIVIEWEN